MPAPRPNQLSSAGSQPAIFTSAASDPPIPRTSRRMRVAAIAMGIAAVIWSLLAIVNLGPDVPIDIWLMAVAGAVLDGFVALELWQLRWSRTVLLYVIARTGLAAAGFSLLCLPFYIVALIAIPISSPFTVAPDPDVAHPFQRRQGAIALLAPFYRRTTETDAGGSALCACGRPQRDEVHDPSG